MQTRGGHTSFLIRLLALLCLLSEASRVVAEDSAAPKLDFNRDVRPILSDKCFKCHGFDPKTRKADRRLDTRDGALAEKDGVRAIVPGNLDDSDVHVRIHSTDHDEQMPPPKSGKSLTPAQIATLDHWIEQGAKYDLHWAFKKPVQAALPPTSRPEWMRNPIDHFVMARLDREGLNPAPEGDRYTLVRRVSFDLTGLPPTVEEAEAFARDADPHAYERLVDRLLASPQYGERWARRWLDLARYADTNGYEKDRDRSIWPYRDWVVKALNAGMPFDEFTIEQLAGDLLPSATTDQRIATGFHRNTMLNEEGGIDAQEYRFLSIVDRVAVTGATWFGLTVQCAQCHTHKYDPITQRDYYALMAFLNNADEPELALPPADAAGAERNRQTRLANLLAELPGKFPVPSNLLWRALRPISVATESGQKPKILDDASALFGGAAPEKDGYVFSFDLEAGAVEALQLEALADPSLTQGGPGRAYNGNFVLDGIEVEIVTVGGETQPVAIASAKADASQSEYGIENALKPQPGKGWAVDLQNGHWHENRVATFTFKNPIQAVGGERLVVKLSQHWGQQTTIGRVRLSAGAPAPESRSVEARRQEALEHSFNLWLEHERSEVVAWTPVRPLGVKSNGARLETESDDAIFISGDMTKSDWFEATFAGAQSGITAIRLEVLADERLPAGGPGRVYYEGPAGDFFLSEFTVAAEGQKVALAGATQTFAKEKFTADKAIDGDPQSGWSIEGGQGRDHAAVFRLASPLTAREFSVKLLCERYYAAGLGKFRISVSTDPRALAANEISPEIEKLLLLPDASLTATQRAALRQQFLLSTPALASAQREIEGLLRPARGATTLVLQERPADNPRKTQVHHRGEFLQLEDEVQPAVPAVLGALPEDAPCNRLSLARWLVSPENPLTARVIINREWAAFFGRGLVRTIGDFGSQGSPPSHPELLDWLAVEFMKQGWQLKQMEKLIVMSAAYRQSSATSFELAARDPENELLARGPRFRLDAEMVRDGALRESGLLSLEMGGPGVRPPQPVGVTEAAYGNPKWNADSGKNRYRRSLYTFAKRSAPFALYNTFDAPTGEACIVHRDVSDTPLQALALLNDVVFLEAAQALGRQFAEAKETPEERIAMLFQKCLTRPPSAEEVATLLHFLEAQRRRLRSGELDARAIAGSDDGDRIERAAWTTLARAIFNFDEAITKS